MGEAEVAVFVTRRKRAEVLVAGGIDAAHSMLVDAPGAWEPALDREHEGFRWCAPDDACTTFHRLETADTLRLLLAAP